MTFVLGLDMDNTLGDYEGGLAESVARDIGVPRESIPRAQFWQYEKSWPGIIRDHDHFLEFHERAVRRGLFRWMPAYEGASRNLWNLSSNDVHIRIITHRMVKNGLHRMVATDTVEWLETENIPYRDLCFTGHKVQVSADVYVDDAPHNIMNLRESGGYVITYDQPYNRDISGPRAHNWDELADMIMARKAEVDAEAA